MSDKYYRVIKDTPQWEVGAILKNNSAGGYVSIDELFNKDYLFSDYYEAKSVIEGAVDYFQRVYPVNLITRTVYKIKEEAKAAIAKQYTEQV